MLPYPLKLRLFVQQQRSTDCDHESTQAALSMSQNEKGKEKTAAFSVKVLGGQARDGLAQRGGRELWCYLEVFEQAFANAN